MKTKRKILTAVMMIATIGLLAGGAQAANLFTDDFESPDVGPGPFGTFNGVPRVSNQRDTAKWVGATNGFGATENGLVDESSGDFANDPNGAQAYGFRYTNSGVTTAQGVIGTLGVGTYTVSFDVVEDLGVAGTSYGMELVAFDPGDARSDVLGRPGTVLATASGNAGSSWTTDGATYTALATDPLLGKDVGIRFIGATSSAVIDDVLLDGPTGGNNGGGGGDLNGQLGVLDPANANGGINPATGAAWEAGDQYRLVFITSQTTQATSTDIDTYNDFVSGVAAAAGLGTDWNMVGSTLDDDARDNTGTNPSGGTGVGVFLTDGVTMIAANNTDLWNGIAVPVSLDEYGQPLTDNRTFTGSDGNGTAMGGVGSRVLGGSSEPTPLVRTGDSNQAGGSWMKNFNNPAANFNSVFAMSGLLNIISGAPAPTNIRSIDDLFNTGVDGSGAALGDNVGDSHYALIVDPSGLGDATVTDDNFPIPPWFANSAGSRWIGPADGDDANGPGGDYAYRTTFTLPIDADLASVMITGLWGTDNVGQDILINGISTGLTNTAQFGSLTSFSIDSGFQIGLNTLDFIVNNAAGGPTGLRVDNLRGSFHVPEPATMALLSLAAAGLGGYVRKRRNA